MKKSKIQPQFPLYIPSKGRAESRMTVKALNKMGVDYYVVIEEQEYKAYSSVIPKQNILVLDRAYQRNYDTCDSLGYEDIPVGAGAARNFIWDHSISNGHKWHWTMDDNIRCFEIYNRNKRVPVWSGAPFKAMEDFSLRYKNVAMTGPNYHMFIVDRKIYPPFVTNTRIYSCNLIRNDIPFRWRGRYNEDTILSIDILKAGWCTIQFNAFLQHKTSTQVMKGGNTDTLYKNGTAEKSRMLARVHPDVAKTKWRFNREHHYVNYHVFKQKLIKKDDIKIESGINNYGLDFTSVKRRNPKNPSE
jgi:hypothetical protein